MTLIAAMLLGALSVDGFSGSEATEPWGLYRLSEVLAANGTEMRRVESDFWYEDQPADVCRVLVLDPEGLPPEDASKTHVVPMVYAPVPADAGPWLDHTTADPNLYIRCVLADGCDTAVPLGLPLSTLEPDEFPATILGPNREVVLQLSDGRPVLMRNGDEQVQRSVLADNSLLSNVALSFATNREFAADLLGCEYGYVAVVDHRAGGRYDFATEDRVRGMAPRPRPPALSTALSVVTLVLAWFATAAMLGFRVPSPRPVSRDARRHVVEHARALAARLWLHRAGDPEWAPGRVRSVCLDRLTRRHGALNPAVVRVLAARADVDPAALTAAIAPGVRPADVMLAHNRILLKVLQIHGDA